MKLIAGSGRSGTTWVLDCLAVANGLRPIFEPLHPSMSTIGARYAHRFISGDESHSELKEFFAEVQRRQYWSLWTTYRNSPKSLFPAMSKWRSLAELKRTRYRWRQFLKDFRTLHNASRRPSPVIKCIRANLALGWLVRQLSAKAVLIVRHPSSVVESQNRLGVSGRSWNPWPVLERLRADRQLNEFTGGTYLRLMNRNLTKVEALTLLWVMENQWPVENAAALGYKVVFYEDLISDPETQWRMVCNALSLTQVPAATNRQVPSQQASRKGTSAAAKPGLGLRFDTSQLMEVQRVLDESNCHLYRADNPQPLNARVSTDNGR